MSGSAEHVGEAGFEQVAGSFGVFGPVEQVRVEAERGVGRGVTELA
jgi:hypothetical protein